MIQEKYKQAVERNVETIEQIKGLVQKIYEDDTFMAHIARSSWAFEMRSQGSVLEQLQGMRGCVNDLLSFLANDLKEPVVEEEQEDGA